MKTACIIPARMGSSRFFGKPIKKILGHSMIEHVYRRVRLAKEIDEVYVATCDDEIAEETKKFGGDFIMTSDQHERGTERVAEAAEKVDCDIILNVQGDEPLVDPASLDNAIRAMKQDPAIECMNAISVIDDWEVFVNEDVVKTVIDLQGDVLYFSRKPVPTIKKENFKQAIKQIGIYFFKRRFLLDYMTWEQTPLEVAEAVDMMRFLEKGYSIKSVLCKDMISIDTPEELDAIEKVLVKEPIFNQIFGDGKT